MASQYQQLHFILFPLMSPGHMIPMIDIAKLLAETGSIVTIISTPLNAARFEPVIARAIESGLQIRLHILKFPLVEAGLPEGCENFDMLPSLSLAKSFFDATTSLQPQLEQFLKEAKQRPSCIISDGCLPYTTTIARDFNIPRIVFQGPGCFPLLCSHNILSSKILVNATSETEPFVVPNMPDQIEFTKAQLFGSMGLNLLDVQNFGERIQEAEKEAYGIVVNTFEELEPQYVTEYKRVKTTNKVWCIGPVSLSNKEYLDKAERGNKASIDGNQCLNWLDSWEPSSVIYACLGSLCNLTPPQMVELGLGLEASNKPFIWVIRGNNRSKELEKLLLEEGFEEKTKGRGLVIWGWAPQVLILSHSAIGGFLTHCGWNSTLEGVCAGVPMITCPLFSDQAYNEKLIVQVLGFGVMVGVEVGMAFRKEEDIGVLVKKENVKKAIDMVMDEGEEGEKRRKKARELGEMSKRAMAEGGSSHTNMTLFVEDIMQQTRQQEPI